MKKYNLAIGSRHKMV